MKVKKSTSGSALIIAMLSVFLIGIIVAGMFIVSQSRFLRAMAHEYEDQAYYTAKSALDIYKDLFSSATNGPAAKQAVVGVCNGGAGVFQDLGADIDLTAGGMGTCNVEAAYNPGNKIITLRATANVNKAEYVMYKDFSTAVSETNDFPGHGRAILAEPDDDYDGIVIYSLNDSYDVSNIQFLGADATKIVIVLDEGKTLRITACERLSSYLEEVYFILNKNSFLNLINFQGTESIKDSMEEIKFNIIKTDSTARFEPPAGVRPYINLFDSLPQNYIDNILSIVSPPTASSSPVGYRKYK